MKLLLLTTTHGNRLPLMTSTVMSAMKCLDGATFVIQSYDEVPATVKYWLSLTAQTRRHKLIINHVPPDWSVAKTKVTGFDQKFDKFINLDDDLLINELSWGWLQKPGITTVGVVDAENVRQFADYNKSVYRSPADYRSRTGDVEGAKTKHHIFQYVHHVPTKWLSQLYSLPYEVWNDKEVWDEILAKFSVKGVRGYDVMLERLLAAKYPMDLYTGMEALHIGLEEALLGSNWQSLFEKEHYVTAG